MGLKPVSSAPERSERKVPETIFSILLDGRRVPYCFPLPVGNAVNGTGLSVVMLGWRRARRYVRQQQRWRSSLDAEKKKLKQEEGGGERQGGVTLGARTATPDG